MQTGSKKSESTMTTLTEDERTKCEVWTRVMGYHRPVAGFNVGKKGEHAERKNFKEPTSEVLNGRSQ